MVAAYEAFETNSQVRVPRIHQLMPVAAILTSIREQLGYALLGPDDRFTTPFLRRASNAKERARQSNGAAACFANEFKADRGAF
jgi:hypothetical protein